ncbi:MAG: FAD-dependent oxidoreductase [Aeromicrobium sp.]|nr:MAG: FAD-dependent oxidoreductase [Aeromicrobium sp.]
MDNPWGSRGVVIIGGGVAGVTAAFELRKRGYRDAVTILEAGTFPHDRPPLTKGFLSGTLSDDDVSLYTPEAFAEEKIGLKTHASVLTIDTHDLGVELRDGTRLDADFVVLATGGLPRIPAVCEDSRESIHWVRTIEDARRLKRELQPGRRLLVIGGGLLGVELSYTARELGLAVTIVEPVSRPLVHIVGDRLADWLHAHADQAGIVQHEAEVLSITQIDGLFRAELSDGSVVECDVVVAAAGFEPNTRLAGQAGLNVRTGVVVDAGQRTSDERIFAVGDCAERHESGEVYRGGHWEAAKLDGERVACIILGEAAKPHSLPWFWTDRGELHIDVIGQFADCEETLVRGQFGSTSFSVIGLNNGRVAAAACVNDPKTARQLRKIIENNVDCTPDELRDTATDLRRILKR